MIVLYVYNKNQCYKTLVKTKKKISFTRYNQNTTGSTAVLCSRTPPTASCPSVLSRKSISERTHTHSPARRPRRPPQRRRRPASRFYEYAHARDCDAVSGRICPPTPAAGVPCASASTTARRGHQVAAAAAQISEFGGVLAQPSQVARVRVRTGNKIMSIGRAGTGTGHRCNYIIVV